MRTRAVATLSRAHGALVHPRRVRVLADAIAPWLEQGAHVLDVGCGDGRVAALLLERRPDLSLRGIDVLARPGSAIETTRFDGARIPFPDAAFDAALLVDVLHHAEDAERLLGEAARVAPRCVVVKDHFRRGFAATAALRFMDWVGNRGHGVALPYRYLDEDEWRDLFVRLDLEVERRRDRLGLYPQPFSRLFDRDLHFVARLRREGSGPPQRA